MGLDGFFYETGDRADISDQRWDRVSLIYKLIFHEYFLINLCSYRICLLLRIVQTQISKL